MPHALFDIERSRTIQQLKDLVAALEETNPSEQSMDGHDFFKGMEKLDRDIVRLKQTWASVRQEASRIKTALSTTMAAKRRRTVFEQRFIEGRRIREIAKSHGKGVATINYDIRRHYLRLCSYACKSGLPYMGYALDGGKIARRGEEVYALFNSNHEIIYTSAKVEELFPQLTAQLRQMNIDPVEYVRLV